MVRVNKKNVDDVRKHYSISKILDTVLAEYVSDENQDITTMIRKTMLGSQIAEIERDLKVVESKKHNMEIYLKFLKEKRDLLDEEVKRNKEISLLYKYHNVFRRICIAAKFDIEEIKEKGGDTIAMIRLIDPTFNVNRFVTRYKALLEE
jgi:hypothetical protein